MAWSIFFLFSKTTRTSLSCCPSNPKGWYVQPPEKHTLLRVITTVTLFCHSFLHLMWKYIWNVFSDILFWLSIRILFWHSFWHLFWHFIWHSIWHSIMAFYLKSKIYNILWHSAFSLAISLACVRIQGHSTASWARDVAPGPGHCSRCSLPTSQLRSGSAYCDLELAVEVRKEEGEGEGASKSDKI